jgi:hypothetical protein
MNLFQEGDGRLNGPEQLRSLITSGRRSPIGDTLGFALTEVAEARAVLA